MAGLSALVALAGVGLIAGGIVAWRRSSAEQKTSGAWPSVQGVVDSAGVIDEYRWENKRRVHVHQFNLNYHYEVAGKNHIGSSYTQMAKNWPALVEKYRAGAPIPVFYNPQIPSHHDIRDKLLYASDFNTGSLAIMLLILGVIALGWSLFL